METNGKERLIRIPVIRYWDGEGYQAHESEVKGKRS